MFLDKSQRNSLGKDKRAAKYKLKYLNYNLYYKDCDNSAVESNSLIIIVSVLLGESLHNNRKKRVLKYAHNNLRITFITAPFISNYKCPNIDSFSDK